MLRFGRLLVLLIMLLSFQGIVMLAQESTPEATAPVLPITPTPMPTMTATNTSANQTHTVVIGDTLFRIARRYGVTIEAIMELNGITNRNNIVVGTVLKIPDTTNPVSTPVMATPTATSVPVIPTVQATTEPSTGDTYTVVRGDTLFRIATRFNTTVGELQRLNNISNINVIEVGQVLILSGEGTTPAVTVTPAPLATTTSVTVATAETTESMPEVTFGRGIEVFIAGQDIAQLTETLTQLDIEWVKITMNWRNVEQTQGDFNLTEFDLAIDSLNAANIQVMLTLTGAPDWARPSATPFVLALPSYGPPDDPTTFGTFAGQIAQRYGDKVQAYEIWVEPNLRRSWISADTIGSSNARLSSVSYLELLESAYSAIKAVNEDLVVVSAGLAPTGLDSPSDSIPDRRYLENLLASGLLNYVDAVGVEPDGFANPPDSLCCTAPRGVSTHFESPQFYFLNTLQDYRVLLVKFDGADVPLWATRFGWGSAEGNTIVAPNSAENPFLNYTDAEEQATYTTRAFELGADSGYVGAMFLYNLNGCQVGNGEACFYSLILADGTARSVGEALGFNP
jgi:polysaccharide biosynthesis protein PslG